MTVSREERAYRTACKKCIKGESKTRLLEDLVRRRLGLREVEEFIKRDRRNYFRDGEENLYTKKKKFERPGIDCQIFTF